MPERPTRDTIAVNLELPADLVRRVRAYAESDERSIKSVFVKALRLWLDTYDSPAAPAEAALHTTGAPGETVREESSRPPAAPAPKPASALARMGDDAFTRFLEKLAKRKNPVLLQYLAIRHRHGLTVEQIVAENPTLRLNDVLPLVETLEKAASQEVPQ